MKENKKKIRDVPLLSAILITILFMVFLFLSDIFTVLIMQLNLNFLFFLVLHFAFRFLTQVILVILLIAFLLGFIENKRVSNQFLPFMRLSKGNSIKKTFLVGIFAFLGFWLVSLIMALILGMLTLDITLLIGNPDPTGNLGWFMFILALNPGIWEELGFRGVMLSNLEEKYSVKTSILISSVLFGLFHFANLTRHPLENVLYEIFMAILLGISWGYLVSKSKTVLPAILAHYLIDAIAFALINYDLADITIITTQIIITTLSSVTINFILGKFFFNNKNH